MAGSYYYNPNTMVETRVIQGFHDVFRRASAEKKAVMIANLHNRIRAVKFYDEPPPLDDSDIPF